GKTLTSLDASPPSQPLRGTVARPFDKPRPGPGSPAAPPADVRPAVPCAPSPRGVHSDDPPEQTHNAGHGPNQPVVPLPGWGGDRLSRRSEPPFEIVAEQALVLAVQAVAGHGKATAGRGRRGRLGVRTTIPLYCNGRGGVKEKKSEDQPGASRGEGLPGLFRP